MVGARGGGDGGVARNAGSVILQAPRQTHAPLVIAQVQACRSPTPTLRVHALVLACVHLHGTVVCVFGACFFLMCARMFAC